MNNNMQLNNRELQVLNLIKNNGAIDKPISQETITKLTGIKKRMIEEIVKRLRCDFGHPIVSSKKEPFGYFMPRTEEEKRIGLSAYKKQITTSTSVVEAVESVDLESYWR